jgi:hypothetical protein
VRDRCSYCEDDIGSCAHQLVSHSIQSRRAEATEIDLKIGALYEAAGSEFLEKGAPIWPPMYIGQNSVISQNLDARGRPASCDRATENGGIAHAPPTSLMKSRRFMSPRGLPNSLNCSGSIHHWEKGANVAFG